MKERAKLEPCPITGNNGTRSPPKATAIQAACIQTLSSPVVVESRHRRSLQRHTLPRLGQPLFLVGRPFCFLFSSFAFLLFMLGTTRFSVIPLVTTREHAGDAVFSVDHRNGAGLAAPTQCNNYVTADVLACTKSRQKQLSHLRALSPVRPWTR